MFNILMAVLWIGYLCIMLKRENIRQMDLTLPVMIIIIYNIVEAINKLQAN